MFCVILRSAVAALLGSIPLLMLVPVAALSASRARSSGPTLRPASSPAAQGRALGQVALWHMDEPSGAVMTDSARAHDGTLHAVQTGLPGLGGSAYGFTRSWVSVPNAPDLNPGRFKLTLTIHVNTTGAPLRPDWDIMRKGRFGIPGGQYKLELQPSGQASCGFAGSNRSTELIAGPAISDGRWHEVKCVKTRTSIRLIVDGRQFSKRARIGSISTPSDLTIGARPGSEFFRGLLDEASVRIG